jgi:hypothetical protein
MIYYTRIQCSFGNHVWHWTNLCLKHKFFRSRYTSNDFKGNQITGHSSTSALVDRSSQRPVLLAATAVGEVSLFIAGICFYATLNQKVNRSSNEWISLFAADVYCMMYCLALSYLHIGSKVLYPGKGLVVSTGSMWNGVGVIVTQLYQVTTFLGGRFVLILFSVLCFCYIICYNHDPWSRK